MKMLKKLNITRGLAICGALMMFASAVAAQTSKDGSLKSRLPAEIIKRGYISNLVQTPDPPFEYTNDKGEAIGFDIDLANALSEVIDFPIKNEYIAQFAQLVPSMQTGRADISVSSIYDLTARQQQILMVDYMLTGMRFLTRKDVNNLKVFTDFCGKRVVTGNSGMVFLSAFSKETCTDKGLPAIDGYSTDLPQQFIELKLGRAIASFGGLEQHDFQAVMEPGVFKTVGEPISRKHYAIAFHKDNMIMAELIRDAVNELIRNGVYGKLLAKYGFEASAVKEASINNSLGN